MADAKRELLLRVHRHRLRREDLEDCFSQAVVEMVAYSRRGRRFSSRAHIANALDQRFLSRVHDRRRALAGRSPMQAALETALSIDCVQPGRIDIADTRAGLDALVIRREELHNLSVLIRQLTADQQRALAAQASQVDGREFCARHGWSVEKYRKVAQRARARLRSATSQADGDVPSGGLWSE